MGATGCDINLCKNQARRELGKAVEEGGDRELKRQMEEESYGSCDEVIVYDPANKGANFYLLISICCVNSLNQLIYGRKTQ
jgi:hypothetical protein